MRGLIFAAILLISAPVALAQQPRNRAVRGYRAYPRVYYQPNLIWLPSGARMNVYGVRVSPNRRYVRIGVNVGFSQVTGVSTFNFIQGTTNGR